MGMYSSICAEAILMRFGYRYVVLLNTREGSKMQLRLPAIRFTGLGTKSDPSTKKTWESKDFSAPCFALIGSVTPK